MVPMDDELHLAVAQGDIARVRSLLEQGADVNAFDELAKTPLHYAAREEHVELTALMRARKRTRGDGPRVAQLLEDAATARRPSR